MRRFFLAYLVPTLLAFTLSARAEVTLLEPSRVFDGRDLHENWIVMVSDETILYAGPRGKAPAVAVDDTRDLAGQTLMPGLIEGHSHVLLHPYSETPWNDQVLKESEAERVVRAVNHARDSLFAGVTTMRDLGSEGAGYADVAVRDAINGGLIPGPRLIVAGRAIVATGSYGPKGFHEGVDVPLGAETADGYDDLVRVVRSQIGRNIDFVKVYADYRWGPEGTAAPTFSLEELKTIVDTARSSGRSVAAHASTAEAMRRAVLAGVETIEHGDGATADVLRLMKKHGVALCPTLAAGDAISQYRGWEKGTNPEPKRITRKRESFQAALDSGVAICFGGDVGVYPHGDNVRELEMMVDYGMEVRDVLHAATAGNAKLFHLSQTLGSVKSGMLADLISVRGNPAEDVSALREVYLVMKDGVIYMPPQVPGAY
ncbi:amidohydrolase family protein [Congregibacter sp.]|uniref:metal-dependent hydrolase family protein n=1 Tax=Congregibacter sp. TaxID=2744308 RepID=UPI003F6D0F7D